MLPAKISLIIIINIKYLFLEKKPFSTAFKFKPYPKLVSKEASGGYEENHLNVILYLPVILMVKLQLALFPDWSTA